MVDYVTSTLEEIITTEQFELYRESQLETGNVYLKLRHKCLTLEKNKRLELFKLFEREITWEAGLSPIITQNEDASTFHYKNFDGISLRSFIQLYPKKNLKQFLKLSSELTKMVYCFHKGEWIIRNICPENIIVNINTFQCRIINSFSVTNLKTPSFRKRGDFINPCYLSPEQMGFSSYVIDVRSDYYSLGIILYELITGKHPFSFTKSGAYSDEIYGDIIPPSFMDTNIPLILNDIILMLLFKRQNERYQSANGILFDLELAATFFDNQSYKAEFKLGSHDHLERLHVSEELVGRERELKILSDYYDMAKNGSKQVVYIYGNGGVGKSRLVQDFAYGHSNKADTFLHAKFDILQRNTPYSAILYAIENLVDHFLCDEERLDFWSKEIVISLKGNGGILCSVVPRLEAVIGIQQEVDMLPPEETQQRFIRTFLNFILSFATDSKSLCFFLDDLQWADIASINLIEQIINDERIKNLLFIGAYRQNEVSKTDPLLLSLKKQAQTLAIKEICLGSLLRQDIRQLIEASLHHPLEGTEAFIQTIHENTEGNVFFVIQSIHFLYENGLIQLNNFNIWVWDELTLTQAISGLKVLELLTSRISKLSESLKNLLIYCACLGETFDLKTISFLINCSFRDLAIMMRTVIKSGYLIPLDNKLDVYLKTASDTSNEYLEFNNCNFSFSHDIVRTATLKLAKKNDLAEINLQAGRYKMKHFPVDLIDDQIFYIANNYNLGTDLVEDKMEIGQIIKLNFQAGIKAKKASAYDAAIKYFEAGSKHLKQFDDNLQYYNFYLETAICKSLIGRYEEAEIELNLAYQKARTRIEKLEVLFPMVLLYTLQDEKLKALQVARRGYRLYRQRMPQHSLTVKIALLKDVCIAMLRINKNKIARLVNRRVMEDKEMIRFLEFTLAIAPSIYQSDQNLFAWNVMRMLLMTLKHGNNGVSSFGYLGYGMILSGLFNRYQVSKELADLSLTLNAKLGYTTLKWKILLSYYNFVHHWTVPIRPELDRILEIENGAFANGDLVFAGYAIFIYHQKKFALGFNLELLQQSFEDYIKLCEQRRDFETQNFLLSYYNAIRCFRGDELDLVSMGNRFNVKKRIEEKINSASYSIAANGFIAHMTVLYIFNRDTLALDQYLGGYKYMKYIQQRFEFEEFNFYGGLICSAALQRGIGNRKKLIRNFKMHLKQFYIWRNNCPDNFDAQFLILSAEWEKCFGSPHKACQLYCEAIKTADNQHCIHLKAIACELAGRFHVSYGNLIILNAYLANAIKSYLSWGANEKAQCLREEFGMSFSDQNSSKNAISNVNLELSDRLSSIYEAVDVVNESEDIDTLLVKIMNLIVQYFSPDSAFLILEMQSTLVIKTKFSIEDGICTLHQYPGRNSLPLSLINHVTRTRNSLIVEHPALSPEYSLMNYFEEHKPSSILVYPVLGEKETLGVVYLERYLNTQLFDHRSLSILKGISKQLAIILRSELRYYQVYKEKERMKQNYERILMQTQLEIQEQSINKIGREIHDNIGQKLTIAKLNLNTVSDNLSKNDSEKIEVAEQLVATAIQNLRDLAKTMNADNFIKVGLRGALQSEMQILNNTGFIHAEFCEQGDFVKSDPKSDLIVFRIVQEALQNVVKHAQASRVVVTARYHSDGLKVIVNDNGRGFNIEESLYLGTGLRNMQSRAQIIGAGFTAESTRENGTKIVIDVPSIQTQ